LESGIGFLGQEMDKIAELKKVLPSIEKSVPNLVKESTNSLCGPCLKCGGVDRLYIRTDKDFFECRQCGAKGDVIDFHAWIEGTDISGLIAKYLGDSNSDLDGYWDSLIEKYTNKTPIYEYFVGRRKISKDVIDRAIAAKSLVFCHHYEKTVVAGCFRNLETKKIHTVQYISVSGVALNDNGATKLFKSGTKASKGFFIAGVPIQDARKIVLSEAIVNALTVADARSNTCSLALGGSELFSKCEDLRKYRDAGVRIITFMDYDSAGIEATRKINNTLGVKIYNVKWPDETPNKFDPNDLLKSGQRDVIIQMLENPEPAKRTARKEKTEARPINIIGKYRLTDLGNSERLVALHGKDFRYSYPMRKFLVWDGTRWNPDNIGRLRQMCKDVVLIMYAEAAKLNDEADRKALSRWAMMSETTKKSRDMLEFAQSVPGIPILPEHLDQNIYLINCLNGTVDLKTGELKPHNRDDLITKIAPVNYNPDALCPTWLDHLYKIMAGNTELIRFLQKAFGYSITGDTSERKLFIGHGIGANGKTATHETIALVLGDYATRTPTETILIKRNEGIPNDVARLKGARFVYASEAEQGRRLAESLVKDLSGGDAITARFLHQEWFEFHPEFKVWLATNHRPVIYGTDQAIWDRIRLIPFEVRIPEAERIPKSALMEIFKAEADGIFSWLVHGCLAWQREGLGCPDEVKTATESYRNEMDALGDFINDVCVTGEMVEVKIKDLYEAYEKWADESGEKVISKKLFGAKLDEKGFDSYKGSRGVRMRIGIGIKREE
jgi:P4 family phage/plasmid primase-like protien